MRKIAPDGKFQDTGSAFIASLDYFFACIRIMMIKQWNHPLIKKRVEYFHTVISCHYKSFLSFNVTTDKIKSPAHSAAGIPCHQVFHLGKARQIGITKNEIGRASCRERGEDGVGGGEVQPTDAQQ